MADANYFDIRNIARDRPPQAGEGAGGGGGVALPRFFQAAQRAPDQACGSCCAVFTGIIFCALMCIGSVDPLQYGLKYNRFTKQVDPSTVFHGGRYFIGPLNDLLMFPATVQTLEFSTRQGASAPPLETRTAEGLQLSLHVAFQYHLDRKNVPMLYKLASVNYESIFMKVARDKLLKAAAQYTAPQYWLERKQIGEEMFRLVNEALGHTYATCAGLQLLVIDLPAKYEETIVATQVQKQAVQTNGNIQQATNIRAKIHSMVARYNVNITVTVSQAQANAQFVTKKASAEASKMSIEAEKYALASVKAKLGLSEDSLVTYQRNFAYQQQQNATFLFGVQNAVSVLGASSASAAQPEGSCAASR